MRQIQREKAPTIKSEMANLKAKAQKPHQISVMGTANNFELSHEFTLTFLNFH